MGPLLLLVVGLAPNLVFGQPITARVDPPSAIAVLGASVAFCVQAQAPGPLRYQWQKNGLNLSGQTNVCLGLTNLTIADGGSYRALVLHAAGALASEEGQLIIALNPLPGADAFANGAPITLASNSVQGTNFVATREAAEPLHFNLSTSNSVWYTWTAPASGIVTFDTRGSTFDTVLAVYTGSSFATLIELVSDDDDGDFHTSRVRWNAEAGASYRVVIDGVTGETGTYVCNWNLEVTPERLPVFTLRPRSQTVLEGATATFTAAVTNLDPALKFQWFRNGTAMPDATSSNLTLRNVSTIDLGQYRLAATNSAGRSVLSGPVSLEIGPDPEVQSKDKLAEMAAVAGAGGEAGFMMASVGGGTFSLAAGTIINQRYFSEGTMDKCEPAHCGVLGGASRWFQLEPTSDGICTVDTQGSAVDTVLAVYLQNFGICNMLYEPLVDCNNDAMGSCELILASNGSGDRSSRVSFLATAGTVYRAVVDTVGGVRGTNFQFNVHFESSDALPTNTVPLKLSADCLLQLRGSSLTLKVATNLALPGSKYEWQRNARRIAGATRDRLVLPSLNYSDAGRYAATVTNGHNVIQLPGVTVVVVDPCRSADTSNTASPPARVQLLGTSAEAILLEASSTLTATSSWQLVGSIPPSTKPTVWDTNTGFSRFYRASRPPP